MKPLPYSRHQIDEDDIAAVVEVLRSSWLTTGPQVEAFEHAIAAQTGCREAVAVNSGTAALHCAMHALGIGPDDEVIVPALTFAATANCVLYQRGRPVFADVDPRTLQIDPHDIVRHITPRTRALIAVDYAGAACDYDALREICDRYQLNLVADACHSLGGSLRGRAVGSLAELNCGSMHPVKPITSGEGGFVTTNQPYFASRMRHFRNHGIDLDFRQREQRVSWQYAMQELGFNYRLNDIQCALALSQLKRLRAWTDRRNEIAALYRKRLAEADAPVRPLEVPLDVVHAYHLFVVRWDAARTGVSRDQAFQWLRREGIGVNVHYLPVYLHPFYQRQLRYRPGLCPVAETAAGEILSLPMFPAMEAADVERVVAGIQIAARQAAREAG
jgi:perosamine synthetase